MPKRIWCFTNARTIGIILVSIVWAVNSADRVPPWRGGSRGFESLTAQWYKKERQACKAPETKSFRGFCLCFSCQSYPFGDNLGIITANQNTQIHRFTCCYQQHYRNYAAWLYNNRRLSSVDCCRSRANCVYAWWKSSYCYSHSWR